MIATMWRTSRRPGTVSFSMQVTAASWKSYGVGLARSRIPASRIDVSKTAMASAVEAR